MRGFRISLTWLNADGSLNAAQSLDAFLAFWRRHGQPLLGSAPYHEIAPHLVLMAFLHRVVNGDGAPDPLAEGLEQLDGYLAGLGLTTGWLVIFDRRAGQPPIAERNPCRAAGVARPQAWSA